MGSGARLGSHGSDGAMESGRAPVEHGSSHANSFSREGLNNPISEGRDGLRFDNPVRAIYPTEKCYVPQSEKRSEPPGNRFDLSVARSRAIHGRTCPEVIRSRVASRQMSRFENPTQQCDALRVLRQPPIAHLAVPRSAASGIENGCSTFARTAALALLRRRLRAVLVEQATPARLHRHLPVRQRNPRSPGASPRPGSQRLPTPPSRRRACSPLACPTSAALADVVAKLCARPDSASTPMCAFIPKYH